MTKKLATRSLFRAVAAKRPDKGLIHHSDRGSQYCSHAYIKLLDQFGMKSSMSRNDNAPIESFRGTLKSELVNHRHYKTRNEAIKEIREYIEIFYNRQRRQVRLNYLSPAAYEKHVQWANTAGIDYFLFRLRSSVKPAEFSKDSTFVDTLQRASNAGNVSFAINYDFGGMGLRDTKRIDSIAGMIP